MQADIFFTIFAFYLQSFLIEMRCIAIFILILSSLGVYSQVDPVAHFSFDDCSVTDEMGVFQDGKVMGNIRCDCGVGDSSQAFYFDGFSDTISLDQSLKSLFNSDFSISFYLWTENVTDIMSIMSIQGTCSEARDSAFFIRYFPTQNELVVELTKNFGEVIVLRTELPQNTCWNHILFTREGQLYTLYLNGEFIESFLFLSEVVLGQDYPFYIGASPCTGVNEQHFNGRIDELKFFNSAYKTDEELNSLQEFPDQILSADTTIFEGTGFQILTGPSCANSVSWNPATGLDSPGIANPFASPTETTLYEISFDHGSCLSTDEILVSVLSTEEIECQNILLPNAFTPNNDALNERFGISNVFIVESLDRFEIFDNWGMKLFQSFDKNDSWDGTYNGVPSPPGTYVYKLEYTCQGQSFKKAGSFNILK